MWDGGSAKNDLMSMALALFPTSRNGLRNGALVYTPCEVGPKPRLPSTRERDSVLPSRRRGGVLKIDAMSCAFCSVLDAPSLREDAESMHFYVVPQEAVRRRIHAFLRGAATCLNIAQESRQGSQKSLVI